MGCAWATLVTYTVEVDEVPARVARRSSRTGRRGRGRGLPGAITPRRQETVAGTTAYGLRFAWSKGMRLAPRATRSMFTSRISMVLRSLTASDKSANRGPNTGSFS